MGEAGIKRCPFCGEMGAPTKELIEGECVHDPKRRWKYYIECSCGARGPSCDDISTAKKGWESRI